MLAKKVIPIPNVILREKYRKLTALYETIRGNVPTDIYYDEFTKKLISLFKDLKMFPNTQIKLIDKFDFAKSTALNNIFTMYRDNAQISYTSAFEIGNSTKTLSKVIVELGKELQSLITTGNILADIELVGKTNRNNISINKEELFAESFINASNVGSSSLVVDSLAGCLVLQSDSSSKIDLSYSVGVDKEQLLIINNNIAQKEDNEILRNGWYPGSFWTTNPRFGEADTGNTHIVGFTQKALSRLQNESIDSNIQIEYVSDTSDDSMIITLSAVSNTPVNIDTIDIYMGPETREDPVIHSIEISDENDNIYNITDKVLGSGFRVRGSRIKLDEGRIQNTQDKSGKIRRLYIQALNIKRLSINIIVDRSAIIDIPYKALVDDRGIPIRVFNYLESLVLRHPNVIQDSDITQFTYKTLDYKVSDILSSFVNTGSIIDYNVPKHLYSASFYGIDIRESSYEKSGYYESKWIFASANIRGIELYVDEYIPNGLSPDSVRYYISLQEDVWTEVAPVNRPVKNGLPIRLIALGEKDIDGVEVNQGQDKQRFRYRIIMNSDGDRTPCVNNVAIRIKS